MKEIRYEVIKMPRLRIMRRGERRQIFIRIKNVGEEVWYDTSKKKVSDHVILKPKPEDELQDFFVRMGPNEERIDRRFFKVYASNGRTPAVDQHRSRPGESVDFVLTLEAKKFCTRGMHNLSFVPGHAEDVSTPVIQKGPVQTLTINLRSKSYRWLHVKRALRMMLSAPGKVSSEYKNDAFDTLRPTAENIAVVMAAWNRPENIQKTISELQAQKGVSPILYIWNNNSDVRDHLETAAHKSPLPIQITHSASNIGGFGRFYMARKIMNGHDRVIFIDDDERLGVDTIKNLADEFEPHTIKSAWAYTFQDSENYWHKRLVDPGEDAHYLGTGGMIVDTEIFNDPRVFQCPKIYWFIEDLWLSFVAIHHLGWKGSRTNTKVVIDEDGKDQMNKLIDLKSKMLHYLLHRKKWRILS